MRLTSSFVLMNTPSELLRTNDERIVSHFYYGKYSKHLFSEKGAEILRHCDVRATLIDRTISVIAEEGLDGTTTKAIVSGTGINEAYIYKYFRDKEDLMAQTFSSLDEELITKAMTHIPVMYMTEMDFEMRCLFFYTAIWRFLLGDSRKCLAFIRYYFSPYFKKYSSEEHKKRYEPLVRKFNDAFREKANTWMILRHILETMLSFAVKVFDKELPDNDNTAKHVFTLVYASIQPYRKEPTGGEKATV